MRFDWVLTNFSELAMLLISVSGSAECAGYAYEANDNFTIFYNFKIFFWRNPKCDGDWIKKRIEKSNEKELRKNWKQGKKKK